METTTFLSLGEALAACGSTLDPTSFHSETLWIVIVGFIIALVLAAGVGANDVANTFGTSVGAKVITLRNACIMATIFELLGAVALGSKVSDTIRKGIVDLEVYEGSEKDYMLGMLSALGGSAIWLIAATFLKMPISGTHSIVGSVLGFTLVAKGTQGIQWWTLVKIVASWFLSPVLSGIVSGSIFFLLTKFILHKKDPITPGLRSLPIFYGITVFVNIISITLDGPKELKLEVDDHKWVTPFFGVMVAAVLGLLVAILVVFVMVPRIRKKIEKLLTEGGQVVTTDMKIASKPVFVMGHEKNSPEHSKETSPVNVSMNDIGVIEAAAKSEKETNGFTVVLKNEPNHNEGVILTPNGVVNFTDSTPEGLSQHGSAVPLVKSETESTIAPNEVALGVADPKGIADSTSSTEEDAPGVGQLFSMLQVLTAAFGSFAHGGNDVSNAIGPLIALWLVYKDASICQDGSTPIWLLVFGGAGISLGLWIWGRRVIKTMGEDLTKITPSSGFTIEIGAALTVLVASKAGLPVSTTHCKVGSVVTVGRIRNGNGVDWKLFSNIFLAWVVTLPVSVGLSALLMWILKLVV